MPPDRHIPVGAEARGQLRLWKRQASSRFERVRTVFNSDAFGQIGVDFRCRRGKGQQRALLKLQRLLAEARFVRATLDKPAHALWAVLEPREAVTVPEPWVDPGRLQDCVCVCFLAVGRLTQPDGRTRLDGRCGPGIWALEVGDHSLGRLLQRDPAADIDTVMWEAHTAALAMKVNRALGKEVFLLPAGRGCFSARLQLSKDKDASDAELIHVQCLTWLGDEMLQDGQLPIETTTIPGMRLGDNMLLPTALRHLTHVAS